jgi:ADP-heptose:LPS heptosyltransferase
MKLKQLLVHNFIKYIRGTGRFLVLYCINLLILFFYSRDSESKKILIIRLDAIGDFVLWLDAAKALSRRYHNDGKHVTLLANCVWADWAHELGVADEVWGIDRGKFINNLLYRWNWLRRIRKAGFNVILVTAFTRDFRYEDSVVHISGAPERIGSQGECPVFMPWRKHVSDGWYTKLLYADKNPLMELERNAEFVRGVGVADYTACVALLPSLSALPIGLSIAEPYFVIFPGASWSGRQWSTDKFATLLDMLHEQTGWLGVLCGSSEDIAICTTISAKALTRPLVLAGKTSLGQLSEVLRGAKLLVSNETAAVHIASAVNTASVCILGGGHYGRFMPYCEGSGDAAPVPAISKMDCFGCNWICTKPFLVDAPVSCIRGISVERVLEECLKITISDADFKPSSLTA